MEDPRAVLTGRLDLRTVSFADLADLNRIASDPRNFEHVPGGPHEDRAATRAWIERYLAGWAANGLGYWTVRRRADGEVIGVGGVERRPAFWNLYYSLAPACWGHGYATELARAAQSAARARDAGAPLVAWIHAGNAASQGVARHLALRDYGLREAGHWKGVPMHYWADRPPAEPGAA